MSGDDNSDTPSFEDAYRRRLQSEIEALDRELGLVPDRRVVEGPFARLTNRVHAAVTFNILDPNHALVEIGRFEALQELGQGSFGAVFKARDTALDRIVALKLFPAGSHTEEDLRREARALARVTHPNIVEVYDVGRHQKKGEEGEADEDALFIVMEYVEGVSLRDYAVRDKRPWRELLELFIQAGEALATLHEQGVVHGDFKPANVVVNETTNMAYIVDFGLANIITPDAGERERAAIRGGTLYYKAPELLRGGPTSKPADQYAFCVAAWYCLDHCPPYVGDDSDELLEDIDVAAEDVCFADKTIPERFQELLIVGLASEPNKRHASMRALVQELVLLRGPVLVPGPEEGSAVVAPACGERPKPKGLGPVFGLMLLVGMAGVLGELYIEHRIRAVAETEQVITKGDEREFELESPVEHEGLEDAITISDEPGLDLRDEPELDLPKEEESEPFKAAEEALDKGDVQGCYNAWLREYMLLVEIDAAETARLSMALVDKIEEKAPGRPAAAWIMKLAAEAYESVGAKETTDDLTGWEQAVSSRRRAAKLHRAAKEEDEAQQQLDCVKLNKEAKPCSLLFQGRDSED